MLLKNNHLTVHLAWGMDRACSLSRILFPGRQRFKMLIYIWLIKYKDLRKHKVKQELVFVLMTLNIGRAVV